MNNTKTNTATEEFAKELFLLLLDSYQHLKEQKKKEEATKLMKTEMKGGEQV